MVQVGKDFEQLRAGGSGLAEGARGQRAGRGGRQARPDATRRGQARAGAGRRGQRAARLTSGAEHFAAARGGREWRAPNAAATAAGVASASLQILQLRLHLF